MAPLHRPSVLFTTRPTAHLNYSVWHGIGVHRPTTTHPPPTTPLPPPRTHHPAPATTHPPLHGPSLTRLPVRQVLTPPPPYTPNPNRHPNPSFNHNPIPNPDPNPNTQPQPQPQPFCRQVSSRRPNEHRRQARQRHPRVCANTSSMGQSLHLGQSLSSHPLLRKPLSVHAPAPPPKSHTPTPTPHTHSCDVLYFHLCQFAVYD